MGYTIGSGGGPPPDESVSEAKIIDGAVSETKLAQAVIDQLGGGVAQSYMRYTGVAARGSTNTYVWRMSTLMETSGPDITYNADSVNGDSFTVNTSGVYAISVGMYGGTASEMFIHVGPSIVNTVSLSAESMRKADLTPGGTYSDGCNFDGYIAAGDKIWVTSGQAPYNVYPLVNSISIARVG